MTMNDQDVIDRVSCPKCKVKKGQPCVYVPIYVPALYARSRQTQERLARVGTPTKRPHNERRDKLRKIENEAFWAAVRNERQALLAEAEHVYAARAAYAQGVRRETEELVAWLRLNARILYDISDHR
jgi:hypothetical protein